MPQTIQEIVDLCPDYLRERCRVLGGATTSKAGEYVLYWMRTAIRTDENPALDFSILTANKLGLPILVYHALTEKYPYASDRHHTFILQGARDVQQAFQSQEIAYAFHLERTGQRGPHLKCLAERAALVATEDMPTEPLRRWTESLARRASTPWVAVDTACVVPLQLVGKAYERAFEYRNATRTLYEKWLPTKLEQVELKLPSTLPNDLPFKPVDLQNVDTNELVAACEIDHSIGPVPHTVGGSAAGFDRWQEFKDNKLKSYAKARNNPLTDSVSRLSAYLHYGMVSPMRIARETAEIDDAGAEKYLDELLIWRELAYAFCFYRRDHYRTSALPDWALATLAKHQIDRRGALLSWEVLARGRTQDVLWDAAQRSLLIHGELHNNVRMTWGKTLLNWTSSAQQALATMIDLNHRYALDGCDPASYGGMLWCLGQFDRPFPPDRPIFGTVRDRSTQQHAQRLDSQAFLRKTTRPLSRSMPSVAIVGAGVSGLICGRTLQDHGLSVTVFEKSRGVGGRMSTRRTADNLHFDHGAQYFTARDPRFRRYVQSWQHDGVVRPWQARIVTLESGSIKEEKSGADRYVAVPGMNAIGQHLAVDLDVHLQTRVTPPTSTEGQWQLTDDEAIDLGKYDAVIISAPAAQTAQLLRDVPTLASEATRAQMSGCWALMLVFEEPLNLPFEAAFVQESPISWVARNNSKPGRGSTGETWVVHASPAWSEANLEKTAAEIETWLLEEFWQAVALPARRPNYSTAHRWRFALPTAPLPERCLFNDQLLIGACGDWCGGPRVEGAFLSGMAAAGRVMGLIQGGNAVPAVTYEQQRQLF